jgi:hypothetical protein
MQVQESKVQHQRLFGYVPRHSRAAACCVCIAFLLCIRINAADQSTSSAAAKGSYSSAPPAAAAVASLPLPAAVASPV